MKYLVLIASVLIQACIGGVYAWSIFVPKLKSEYSFTSLQSQILFSLTIFTFTFSMIFAGRLLAKKTPRFVASIGGFLFLIGYLIASFSGGSYLLVLLGIAIIAGCGIGFCYICPLSTAVKWFPDKKGLVTGIAVAGFGGGAIALVYFAETLFHMNFSVLSTFRIIGISYGLIILLSAIFMITPNAQHEQVQKFCIIALSKNTTFWLLSLGMFAGTFCGLMFIGNLKTILLSKDVSETISDLAVSFFAIGNASGRILWGFVYDRIRTFSIPISLLATALSVPLLLFSKNPILVVISSALIGLCFGACFVLYASQTNDSFGKQNFPNTYPIIFMLAYGFGGSLGPITGAALAGKSNDYLVPGIISIAFLLTLSIINFKKINSFPHLESKQTNQ